MRRVRIEASGTVSAPVEAVYRVLADYRDHHPHILPKRGFVSLDVEEGGVGAGSIVRVVMRVGRGTRTFRQLVSEPEPGRVLVETDMETGGETTFTLEPEGDGCRVRIETEWPVRDGAAGRIEAWLGQRFLAGLYREELRLLARRAAEVAGKPLQVEAKT